MERRLIEAKRWPYNPSLHSLPPLSSAYPSPGSLDHAHSTPRQYLLLRPPSASSSFRRRF